VPIGIAVALASPLLLPESPRQPGRFDLAGALSSTTGMASLVYGFIQAASHGWGNRLTITAFAAAAVLLTAFVVNESHARQPITPLGLFAHRGRAGSYATRLLLVAGMFGMFYFLTQFVQDDLGFSPLRAGISFLPMTVALFAVSRLSPRLLGRIRGKTLMVAGLIPAAAGMAWLSRISPGSDYVSGVLGPMLLLGAGMGVAFVPLTMASLAGVQPQHAGAASSMVNVTQQVGGSLGLAILVTAYATAIRSSGPGAGQHPAVVHAMASAFTLAAVFDVLALLITMLVIRDREPAAAVMTHAPAAGPGHPAAARRRWRS
jgi:predicted MFS family arabinose efflux permease